MVLREKISVAKVPVIITGGVTEGAEAESLLLEKVADLIGIGRAMLKDTDWSSKALEE